MGQSLILRPGGHDKIETMLGRAVRLQRKGQMDEALAQYQEILKEDPDLPLVWINLGVMYRQWRKLDLAEICLRKGVMLKRDDGNAWSNLGNLLRSKGRLDEARVAQVKALELMPGEAKIHYNYGLVLRDLGLIDDAFHSFNRAKLLGYGRANLTWDMAICHLLRGDLKTGFADFSARWSSNQSIKQFPTLAEWKGQSLFGKSLILYAEDGYGDAIQMLRFLPYLAIQADRVAVELSENLLPITKLLQDRYPNVGFYAFGESEGRFDYALPMLDLPRFCAEDDSDYTMSRPYIEAPEHAPRIRRDEGRVQIGLVWGGAPDHPNDYNRSIALSELSPFFDIPALQFYALQLGEPHQQLIDSAFNVFIKDMSPHMKNFGDTAGLIENLDLVITVDTAIAHLAGAMGKDVWVLLPFSPDWRWALKTGESRWYPSMRLYRQTSHGDWSETLHRVRRDLVQTLRDMAAEAEQGV